MKITNILIGLLIFTNIAFSQSSAAFWLAGGEEEQQTLPIVTNGLIAYYDASNVDSYDPANPGSTWNDLSGNNYHVTNYGATHSTDYGGVFYFDGVDDYMVYEGAINEDVMTFSIWTKGSNITTNCIIDLDDINLTNDLNQELLFFNGISNDQFAIQSELSGTYELTGNSSYVINENIWYYITFTYNSGTYNLYINNVLISTTTDPSADLGAFDFFFNGYIGELFFYDRVLTSQELTDNYNATKDRYVEPCDEYYYNTSLLLHMDGDNGSTVFTDNSINNSTITAIGNVQISTDQSVFGGASAKFDGTDDALSIPYNSGFLFDGDFTIELWVYKINSGRTCFISAWETTSDRRWELEVDRTAGKITFFAGTVPVEFNYSGTMSNSWNHIAVSRESGTLRIFQNGSLLGSTTVTNVFGETLNLRIGELIEGATTDLTGYIDDVRITKGVARYTANFTPPTAPFQDNACLWDGTQTSLLDDYPGAAAAYSVRALNSAYTGPLIKIRRSSDNEETDIYALANGDLDEDLINYFCSGTTCYVKTWYDQSGNGNNATQATTTDQPKIWDSATGLVTENGKPAIQFDGTDDYLDLPKISFNLNNFSAIINFTLSANSQTAILFSHPDNQRVYLPFVNSGTFYAGYNDSATKFNLGAENTNSNLISMYAGSTTNAYLNGVGQVPITSATNTAPGDFLTIGAYQNNVSVSNFVNAKIQGAIIYPTNQTANRVGIETSINNYFSIY